MNTDAHTVVGGLLQLQQVINAPLAQEGMSKQS